MKVKVFHVRLTKENQLTDQEDLNNFLETITVKKTATELISGQLNFWTILVFYEEQKISKQEAAIDKIAVISEIELTEDEKQIFNVLKEWRKDKAIELNIPSFMVCHNTELMTIAKVKPTSLDELIKIKGFGGVKVAKIGNEILEVLNSI